jgi:hypothetical protein
LLAAAALLGALISNHDGNVNSMVEMGENEVWLHGDLNSMVAEMELGGVVEVGRLQVVRRQLVRSTHARYFNKKFGVLENCTVRM